MRRPAQTKAQRQHAREMRALLRLRRAAVRYSLASDGELPDLAVVEANSDLHAASDAYTNALGARDRRKLAK